MKAPLHALDVDLHIEHAGRQVTLRGEAGHFTARFESLASLVHFAHAGWPLRHWLPRGGRLYFQWRSLKFPVPL